MKAKKQKSQVKKFNTIIDGLYLNRFKRTKRAQFAHRYG